MPWVPWRSVFAAGRASCCPESGTACAVRVGLSPRTRRAISRSMFTAWRSVMTDITAAGSFRLGDRLVNRMGYGAMQLAGPGVFGPPRDRGEAIAVLREAVANRVNHIDTSDFYGPHVVNEIIAE